MRYCGKYSQKVNTGQPFANQYPLNETNRLQNSSEVMSEIHMASLCYNKISKQNTKLEGLDYFDTALNIAIKFLL